MRPLGPIGSQGPPPGAPTQRPGRMVRPPDRTRPHRTAAERAPATGTVVPASKRDLLVSGRGRRAGAPCTDIEPAVTEPARLPDTSVTRAQRGRADRPTN